MRKPMKARECPYCHESISKSRCFRYILKGRNRSLQCNHCHKQVSLPRKPIPDELWGMPAGIGTTCSMFFFLFHMQFDFLTSLLCSLPILALIILAMIAYSLCRMKLSKEEDT